MDCTYVTALLHHEVLFSLLLPLSSPTRPPGGSQRGSKYPNTNTQIPKHNIQIPKHNIQIQTPSFTHATTRWIWARVQVAKAHYFKKSPLSSWYNLDKMVLENFCRKRLVKWIVIFWKQWLQVVVQLFFSCSSRRNKAIWVEKSNVSARTVLWLSWGVEGSKTRGFIISRNYPRLHFTL